MSEYCFGLFRGHLTLALIRKIEQAFPHVSVINYTEPRGEKRGWFSGPNHGNPFDREMAAKVLAFARAEARGRDIGRLGVGEAANAAESGRGKRWGRLS